jgi:periplasmic divalent cation tolerance protein
LLQLVNLTLEGLIGEAGVLGVGCSLLQDEGGGLEKAAGPTFNPGQGVMGVTKTPPPSTDLPHQITVECSDRYIKNHNPNHHHLSSKRLHFTASSHPIRYNQSTNQSTLSACICADFAMRLYYITLNTAEEAKTISHALLDQTLALCTNWFPITCAYRWEGDIITEPETVLIVKTQAGYRDRLEQVIREHIDYTHCILELTPNSVNAGFLAWLNQEIPVHTS